MEALLSEYAAPAEDDDLMHEIRRIVASELTEAERRVFILHAEGWSYRELAPLLGVSKSAVGGYYNAVRRKIRAALARKGLDWK